MPVVPGVGSDPLASLLKWVSRPSVVSLIVVLVPRLVLFDEASSVKLTAEGLLRRS